MKNISFKLSFKAIALVALSCMFANHAVAQTSVTIKVNPNAAVTVGTPAPATQCPAQATAGASTASYLFPNLSTLAGVTSTNATLKYYATRTGTAPNYTYSDEITTNEYTVNAITTGTNTKTIYVIGLSSLGCKNDTASFDLSVYTFPNISISGGNASECAGSTITYTASATTGISSYKWTVTGGTLAGGLTTLTESTGSVNVTWGAAGTGTLNLEYTSADGCIYTTPERSVTINPVAVFTMADITQCYAATVDLTAGVTSVTVVNKATDLEYSDDNFVTTIANPAAYTVPVAGVTKTIYVRVKSGSNCASTTTFALQVYADITATLEVVTGANTTGYEACDNGTNTVTLKVTVTGGCPTAPNYNVTLNVGSGITLGSSTADVTVNGNVLTIDRTKANAGATFIITATSGTDAAISVTSVAQDGTAPCACTKTF